MISNYYLLAGRIVEAAALVRGLSLRTQQELQYIYTTVYPELLNVHDVSQYTDDLIVPTLTTTKMSANVNAADLVPNEIVERPRGEAVRFKAVTLTAAHTLGATGNMFWRISAPVEWLAFLATHLHQELRIEFIARVNDTNGAQFIAQGAVFDISDIDSQYIHFVKVRAHSDVVIGAHSNLDADTRLTDVDVTQRVQYRIVAPRLSQMYELLQLSGHNFDISGGGEVRLTRDTTIESAYSSQVDTSAYFSRLNIVSASLQTVAERDYSYNARLPIVTSYKLPAAFQASCKATGEIDAFNSQPYGQLDFTAVAPRKMHELVGGWEMRAIEMQAELIPKHGAAPVNVMLGPGQHFSIQLVFQKRP